ncbi:hypothetical protein ACSBR2_001546 [Camellia fascicularis]
MESFELPEVMDECEDVSHRCLVGKILAPKILNKPAVNKILFAAWKSRVGVSITPWKENIYLFQFEDLEDRSRFLLKAPWSVMGSLLVLQTLQLGMAADDLDFRWSPFWVQVHGLPFEKMTRAHGEVIRNRIGRLVEVESLSDSLLIHRRFLRLCIEVDVTKPLLQGFILYRRDSSGPIGDGVKVYYKYEKLTKFRYDCGHIGHDNLSCKFVSREEGRNSGYGPNQRTGPARSMTSLRSPNARPMEELRADRDKSMQPLSIPLGAAAASSIGDEVVAASGSAAPSSHNLDENVESEVPRPCTSGSPLEPSSLLDPSSHALNLLKWETWIIQIWALMECSVLRPKASYFVMEPFEAVSSISQPNVNTPYSNLSVEELSPSPSPERPRPKDSLIDSSISQPKPRAISRRGSRLKKVPLVEIPIQTATTAVIPSPGGAVPMGVVSLVDNECCTKVLGLFLTRPSERRIRLVITKGWWWLTTNSHKIHGLGRPLTVQVLRGLCTTHRPSVIFLMETKNKRAKLDRNRQSLNFSNSCYVEPIGTSGGLALWWMDGVVVTNEAHHKQLSHELESVMRREEMYLHQRSRVRWLNFGDRNSAFFHATITQRCQRNQLLQLKSDDGSLLNSEIYHNALATCQNLFSKRCANTACCPVCLTATESIEHLLFDCDWSKRVWFGCNLGLRCDDLGSLSVRDWFGNCFTSLGTSSWGTSVICSMIWVAWTIWKGRNDHLFNHCLVDPARVIWKAKHDEAEFLATCTVTTTPVLAVTGVNNTRSAWVPPPRGKWKFNCDAAFDLRQGTGAVAVLLRDHLGLLVDGMISKIRVRSVAQGELLAVRHACLMAGALNLAAVDIESDCKSVIHLCVSEGVPPWELLALLSDVRSMATHRRLNFLWCPRMRNRAAHWVASAYFHNSLPTDWVAEPPMGLVRCLSSIST